jgi:DNA-binding PucR family transcriptional regulator
LAELNDGEHRLLHECLSEKNHEELFAPLSGLDPELLLTILVYLENGNSPALASIGLYVHRNTVNYRVEHFEKQTGYDLSLCPTSLLVYLLLKKEERNIRAQLLF